MNQQIIDAANKYRGSIELAAILAFIQTETGGQGFDPVTNKITIRFEPTWFKKEAPGAPSGLWSNGTDGQEGEWRAFDDAFSKNPDAAMKSTSIGLGQIMGFNFQRLGYSSVGAMWDDAKTGIERQVWQIVQFINTDKQLLAALQAKDWHTVATLYNGAGFMDIDQKYNRVPYDKTMSQYYSQYNHTT